MLLKPKEITIQDTEGKDVTYIISKFPAVAGREIVTNYVASGIPKLGHYPTNEEMMFKLMCYVAVPREGGDPIRLTTRALVDNHFDSWETSGKIEIKMMEYNCSFFQNGLISGFFADIAQKLPAFLTKTLTALLPLLSQKEKPPSTN